MVTRRGARKKRPSPSANLDRSPYFANGSSETLIAEHHDIDGLHDEKTNGSANGSFVAPPGDWILTKTIPAHLIGNPYFDKIPDDVEGRKVSTNIVLLRRENTPVDFSLSQAICSYGYFCLAPNRWVPGRPSKGDGSSGGDDDEGYLVRPLTYARPIRDKTETNQPTTTHTVLVAIGQDTTSSSSSSTSSTKRSVVVALQSHVAPIYHRQLVSQIDRMLRLDTCLEEFHGLHPEAKARGFGRLYRSPTLFEDMVKTITNCNMKWGGTVDMNAKLCKHVGNGGAFPTPREINAVGADFLKEHCRVGYRGKYIWNLARDIVEGNFDPHRDLELPSKPSPESPHRRSSREEVQKRLLRIQGIGPFAANNILQLMGYFDTHPYDTETVRLWKEEFGAPEKAPKARVFLEARKHYSRYEPYSFTAYWFDLWKNYERRAGAQSPMWSIEQLEGERPQWVESDHNSVFANPPPKPTTAAANSTDQRKSSKRKRV
ncbi:unnamed protein product [Pseudo-nitzschia multistriata]|uniref:HhH-GPD domain-containing protein n=1 Tax=Pseudo-nitzschia multistriata TaxID=183589 RepID=A0A448ZEP5_9STRA|nr:unnamed protein product [Pseudo-nitzschia multistriata]